MTYSKIERIILPLVSCLLLGMTSCTSDNDPEMALAELKFDLQQDVSRSSVTTNTNLKSQAFSVFGDMKYTDTSSGNAITHDNVEIFNDVRVSYDGSKWVYDNPQCWFPDYVYSFVAMHPADATKKISNTTYSDNTLSFNYTLPANFTDTPDLLVATHRRMYKDKKSTPATPVKLKFSHIMSRVNISLKCEGAVDKITITKIELEGVNKTGTFTITPAPLSSGGEQTDDYSSSWTGISNKGTLTANINVDVNANDDKTYPLFPDDNALFVVPQADSENGTMRITYVYGDTPPETLTAETKIGGWESGKIYSYSLLVNIISRKIYMDLVSVKEWKPGSDNDVDVPRK